MTLELGVGKRVMIRVRERGPVWAGAHLSLYVLDKVFDFVLYPMAIIGLGLLWGTAVMMAASLVICLLLLILYDRLSSTRFRDLLGFESIKEAAAAIADSRAARRASIGQGRLQGLVAKIGLFIYLSLWFDPMTCTIFMRPADHYRMTTGYWALFGLSVFISNVAWALLVFFGVESVRALFGLVV